MKRILLLENPRFHIGQAMRQEFEGEAQGAERWFFMANWPSVMVHVECIKCIQVAKNMPIHAKGMFLKMQRVR